MTRARGFGAALEQLVASAAARAGAGGAAVPLEPLAPWIARIVRDGPTPARGPLGHELQLPAERTPRELGVNVFQHDADDADPLIEAAERWARAELGTDAAHAVVRLARQAGAGVGWHGGVRWDGAGWRLKLYAAAANDDGASALARLARTLAASAAGAAPPVAVGVDVGARGVMRARTYVPLDAHVAVELREAARALGGEGVSHQLVGALGAAGAADAKRTIVSAFRPGVPAVAALAAREAAAGATGGVDGAWLAALAADAAAHRVVLAAAAHELDLWSDGRRATDCFVTLCARG